ncbi:MAG: glycosyltransferase family 4 protein [Candidatus Dormibacteria bacterium]
MRILHTAQSYPPHVSGVAEVVSQLTIRLAGMGHEVHVATSAEDGAAPEEVLAGVHVHRFRASGNAVVGMHGALREYVAFATSQAWDIVTLHCAQTWTTDALLPQLRLVAGSKILVLHGVSAIDTPSYAHYFATLASTVRSKEIAAIVGLDESTEETELCRRHVLPPPVIIPNGVDLRAWAGTLLNVRARWDIGGRPWLLSIGNHNPLKGHHRFHRVASKLRADLADVAATIIGNSHPAARWHLGRVGVKGGCWYSCRWTSRTARIPRLRSHVPRDEVISAVREADLVIVPSYWEASPLVVLESMAAGTPWISFDVGCVARHAGGVVVSSEEGMVRVCAELLRDPARRAELGDQGRLRVRETHDWADIVRRYDDLGRRLASDAVR